MSSANGLKVLQILPSIVRGGGAEQSLAMVAPLLVSGGIELHLAFLDRSSDLVEEVERAGVVVHDLSTGSRSVLARAGRIRALLRGIQPDVVHSSLFDADLPTRLAVVGTGARPISTWANTAYDSARRRLEPGYGGWKRSAVQLIDAVGGRISGSHFHAVTLGVAEDSMRALAVSPGRVFVVERGRDLAKFAGANSRGVSELRAELGIDRSGKVLLNVGRQFHQKGHVVLLRAFDRLAAETSEDLHLILVGPAGPATPAVRKQLSAMVASDRVHELGQRSDIVELLGLADLLVLASVAEGAAGSVLEAMAASVPVVATRILGLKGWFDDEEYGFFAEPGDVESLTRALGQALSDPLDAAERAGRAHDLALSRFSLERSATGLAEMYRSVAES